MPKKGYRKKDKPVYDKITGCQLCGKLRTLLAIRDILQVPQHVDVLVAVRELKLKADNHDAVMKTLEAAAAESDAVLAEMS